MAQPAIQSSFNSGEWAPQLYARVDLEKYKSGAAFLRNFFVDYRGGISTRPGTKYILRGFVDSKPIRLIPFQASFAIGYVLEFGDKYVRFYRNSAPVLETGIAITAVTNADPAVLSVINTYNDGDWVYIDGVAGMTELNGHFYIIANSSGTDFELADLFGNAIDSTTFGAYTSGGTVSRVYTVVSPYAAEDLAKLKFALNIDTMILCHPSYTPYSLQVVTQTNWLLAPIVFGTSVTTPVPVSITTTLGGGTTNYSYIITAVDGNGQESEVSTAFTALNAGNLASTAGTNTLTWGAVDGAVSYNVYKADTTQVNPVPVGSAYGFIGNCTGTQFADSNIAADFSQGPPLVRNPFAGGSIVTGVVITNPGSYTVRPTGTFSAPGGGGTTAIGTTIMTVITAVKNNAGTGYVVNDTLTFSGNLIVKVLSIGGGGAIATTTIINGGTYNSALPGLPLAATSTSGVGINATFDLTWGVATIDITDPGSEYTAAPTYTFSAGAAAGTPTLGPAGAGNPSVPAFFQQRLVLAATLNNPQTLYMSQTASYYNFNTSSPAQDDDAITATLVSGSLANIKAMIPQPSGLIVLSDGGAWLLNGGSFGSAVTPAAIVANAQAFIGANDVPPVVVNYDTLFIQSKGSSVRDASYNFYANVFTGADVSVISSHLFFGFQVNEWAWAEEPYKVMWTIRNDGEMLSFTFIKEQDFMAWAHHDTQGSFKSTATVIEGFANGFVNATYFVIERDVQGLNVKYIERMAERDFTDGVRGAWQVDSAMQYVGTATTSFIGMEHLGGLEVTGLADGLVIPPFTMSDNGSFTLGTAASLVTIGLAFTCQVQTLQIDLGEPTVQSKDKKISSVTVRVAETLGLSIGSTFSNLVAMKDLVRGNVGQMTNEVVTDLVTGDAQTLLDPKWAPQGQYCVEQSQPYPATILGVMPQVVVGDTK